MLVYKYRHIKKKTKTTVKEMSTTQSYLPLRLIWHIVMDRIQTLLLNMVFGLTHTHQRMHVSSTKPEHLNSLF